MRRAHDPAARALLVGVGVAPFAWLAHLAGASVLVPFACSSTGPWPIHALTATLGLVCAACAVAAWRWAGARPSVTPSEAGLVADVRTLATLSAAISCVLVLAEGAGALWIGACA